MEAKVFFKTSAQPFLHLKRDAAIARIDYIIEKRDQCAMVDVDLWMPAAEIRIQANALQLTLVLLRHFSRPFSA